MRSLAGLAGLYLLCVGCSGKSSDVEHGAGGAAGIAGAAGGRGGANAQGGASGMVATNNVPITRLTLGTVDKLDVLFMIDNSVSMADKQELLKAAVPVLLGRLVTPLCVDANGNPTGSSAQADGSCVGAGSPEFAPINDIHIGIVSSSLGAHGGVVCAAALPGADPGTSHLDDKGHLIGTVRAGLTTWNNSGFLAWDPTGLKNVPPGTNNANTLSTDFAAMVEATGEHGCGYEASLEAWYRFLIDPEPPATVSKLGSATVRQGIDADLLAQRAAFLRPDSVVAIVMLSDENDCSIRDDGVGWFVGSTSRMPKATAACAVNPNDPCCRSCAQHETAPPSGCQSLSADPVCMGAGAGSYATWDSMNDSLNLRCYDQKQRFGFDLLYETQRYVTGLTSPVLALESDPTKTVPNPLYAAGDSGKAPRDPSLVFLAGIVGVPWQDIATADSLASPTALSYLSASELVAQGRWAQLLGNAAASPPVPPSDPFMIEAVQPRSGVNPNAPISISSPSSMNPTESAINGHEQNIPELDDLQYACTFKLSTPKVCAPGDAACACSPTMGGDASGVAAANSPVCQPPSGGPAGTTQYYAKAYPGARELTVLRDFKENAIVASICPKVTTAVNPIQDPNYGYNPAIAAIISRLKGAFRPQCLPRALPRSGGSIDCKVIEAQGAGKCDCTEPGRSDLDPTIASAVFHQLEASGACGNAAGQPKCDTTGFCMCQINQEMGANLSACQAGAATTTAGFCYVDDPTSPVLENCPTNQKRLLRFIDQANTKTPAPSALTFLACPSSPLGGDGGP